MSDDPDLNLLDFPLPAAAFRKARKATLADVNNLSAAVNGGPDYVNKRLLTDKRSASTSSTCIWRRPKNALGI